MADNTVWGVAGIVAIVLVTSIFFSGQSELPEVPQPPVNADGSPASDGLTGFAYTTGSAQQDVGAPSSCNAMRFCEGTKLQIIRDDCSMSTAYCKHGCRNGACL